MSAGRFFFIVLESKQVVLASSLLNSSGLAIVVILIAMTVLYHICIFTPRHPPVPDGVPDLTRRCASTSKLQLIPVYLHC